MPRRPNFPDANDYESSFGSRSTVPYTSVNSPIALAGKQGGEGTFQLTVSSDDRVKAGQLAMSLMTFLDIASQDFGERFLLRY